MTFIKNIKKDGSNIIIYKCPDPASEILISDEESFQVAFIDVETTGLFHYEDEIIELALKVLLIEKRTGKIIRVVSEFESFNEPDKSIDDRITKLTGISSKMVNGKKISWATVNENLKDVDLIISHNASFDRPFVDAYSEISESKLWACSIKDIDWFARGFTNVKQELLCLWHGFYFEAHRAINDVSALIHLLTHPSYNLERPLIELIENSEHESFNIWVTNFPYSATKKDKIKSKGYNWNVPKKLWFKRVLLENIEEEKSFLIDLIYFDTFRGLIESIDPVNKYKSTLN
jgi:DNA polymerase-3 subunit epsilon